MPDVKRGCGYRQAGGLYLTCPLGERGVPVEHFLIDPPIFELEVEGIGDEPERVPIADAWRLSPIGVTIMEIPAFGPGYHVVDWIGAEHYPNVADFVEEVKRFGVSRRISKATDFSLLTRTSRMVLSHPAAHVEQYPTYDLTEPDPDKPMYACPRLDHKHDPREGWPIPGEEMCARTWWQDVRKGESVSDAVPRVVRRTMPSFSYTALAPPEIEKVERKLALFAAFPIHHIEAIKDREEGKHEAAMAKAAASEIPITLEEL